MEAPSRTRAPNSPTFNVELPHRRLSSPAPSQPSRKDFSCETINLRMLCGSSSRIPSSAQHTLWTMADIATTRHATTIMRDGFCVLMDFTCSTILCVCSDGRTLTGDTSSSPIQHGDRGARVSSLGHTVGFGEPTTPTFAMQTIKYVQLVTA